MKKITVLIFFLFSCSLFAQNSATDNPPIYIAFLWHMHQPIYWPYESVIETINNNRYSYSVYDVFVSRTGPYTDWPKNAVMKGINAGFPNFGSQVSFSGSLIENLNNLESDGVSNFQNWKSHWNYIKTQTTALGNPRIDMVGFGYHHPLMGLIDYDDIRRQIEAHKTAFAQNFSGGYSKGFFPPENAFALRMIPALTDENIEWVLIDNIHFERACENYPFNTGGNLYEANKSDVLNSDPNDWIQLTDIWAPTKVSAQWANQPHYVEFIEPESGEVSKIIAVPSNRYLGVEDGRGGFGALNYETVMSQFEFANTDPDHPILLVLAHDGDNYGGGTDGYYGVNFQSFVNWLLTQPDRFVCATIQDYLEMFPPDANDVIHVESGSWSGADNGDPEFKKWLADPDQNGYSPDRNSWGIVTAAKNFIDFANDAAPQNALTDSANHYFLNSETSDYWYWDYSENGVWDSHPARACNLAVPFAQAAIAGKTDSTPPTIFEPQREPYNPGETEWGISQPSDFSVWTYAFDVNGLEYVTLKYRTDSDGVNSTLTDDNETYSGGSDVSQWTSIPMNGVFIPSQTDPAPLFKADKYSAEISGLTNALVDYYVEAADVDGNIAKSNINHVWIGNGSGGGGGGNDWYVRGTFNNWDTSAPMNDDGTDGDEIAGDGIFSATVVIAQPLRHEWKIGTDDWTVSFPIENSWLVTTVASQTVLFTFDSNNNSGDGWLPTVNIINADDQIISTSDVVCAGDHNGWNNAGAEIMLDDGQNGDYVAGDGIYCYYTVVASPGNYGWKATLSGTWDAWGSDNRFLGCADIPYSTSQNQDVYFYLNAKTGRAFTSIDDPLPVNLTSFFAEIEETSVILRWTTAGEINNLGFEIERARENTNRGFSEWTTVGFVEGGGTVVSISNYSFEDKNLPFGNYKYRLKQIDDDGGFIYGGEVEITIENFPLRFELKQNYPNPFGKSGGYGGSTTIEYAVYSNDKNNSGESANAAGNLEVTLKVYDVLGRLATTLVDEKQSAGRYKVLFDPTGFPSGIYFYRLTAGRFVDSKKMIIIH
ncbi:MAG: T9SS type A sorting domain-containing protein [Chlorobi bacterium]|nr:T9SS type A sorting domain-containing protein [Chlorobiota bacterium]